MRKNIYILFYLLLNFLTAQSIFLEYEGYNKIECHITRTIEFNNTDKMIRHIRIYKISDYNDELYNQQKITKFKIRYNTKPKFKKRFTNDFSDIYYDLIFETVKYENKLNAISYEISFNAELRVNTFKLESYVKYPLNNKKLFKLNNYKKYTDISYMPYDEYQYLNKKALQITFKNKYYFNAIANIYLWVRENIKTDNSITNKMTLKQILLTKKANNLQKLFLLFSLFKSSKIPVRIVSGFSVEHRYIVKKICYNRKNDRHLWLEIYAFNYGWLPVDLSGYLFYLPPFYVKEKISYDFNYDLFDNQKIFLFESIDNKYFKNKMTEFYRQINSFYFSSFYKESKKKVSLISGINKTYNLFVPVNTMEINDFTDSDWNESFIYYSNKNIFKYGFSDDYNYVENISTSSKQSLGQIFYINTNYTIKKIGIPIYQLIFSTGNFFFEIYKIDKNNVFKKIYRSPKYISRSIVNLGRFKWKYFYFKNLKFTEGKYILILKTTKSMRIHWRFSPNSDFYLKRDSLILDNNLKTLKILNGDFNFIIYCKKTK